MLTKKRMPKIIPMLALPERRWLSERVPKLLPGIPWPPSIDLSLSYVGGAKVAAHHHEGTCQ